jgi:hypothetical protein
MGESEAGKVLPFVFHGSTIVLNIFILKLIFKEYKNRIRIFDKIDKLWYDYCEKHDMPFDALNEENRRED